MISRVEEQPAIISPLHVVDQGTKLRLILDLSDLNRFLEPPKFKLEDLKVAWPFLCGAKFAARFDFNSGYHLLPIDDTSKKLLGFAWGQTPEFFTFNALPFGLNSAPYVFTKVFRVLVKRWRELGLTVLLYIDDGLILAETTEQCAKAVSVIRADFDSAGVGKVRLGPF